MAVLGVAVLAVAVLAVASFLAAPALGQTPPQPAASASADQAAESADSAVGADQGNDQASKDNFEAIEDLLLQDEAVLSAPQSYNYDPGTRRDPFRSLLKRRDLPGEPDRERPTGPAGLLIDEIVIEGVFELADGPVAQVQSAREQTSYLLRPGDQLWDGDVVSISLDEVVFKQSVKEPTALKPFREVIKRLNP